MAADAGRERQALPLSLTNRTALGHAVNRIEGSGSKERFVIGTRNPYAQYHHFGTRHMPRRFFMPGDDFGDLIRDRFKQYLEAQLPKV